MNIFVRRFDDSLPMPRRHSKEAAAFDLYARVTTTIEPHTVGYIPLNVALEIPKDCWLLIAARSSTHKLGIMPANGIGVGDPDFCGNDDEYTLAALNFTNETVVIEKGLRIAQGLLVQSLPTELIEIEHLGGKNRGKFGSTGTN